MESTTPTIELRKLTVSDGPLVYRLLQRVPKYENGFFNGAKGLSYEEFKKWLIRQQEISDGIDLEPNMVAQTVYWLVVDQIPVGIGKIRHELTDLLREKGGNVAYSIEPGRRGKGYGKLLLSYLLKEAKANGQKEVILTAYNSNHRSIQVAKANGGKNYRITEIKHYYRFVL